MVPSLHSFSCQERVGGVVQGTVRPSFLYRPVQGPGPRRVREPVKWAVPGIYIGARTENFLRIFRFQVIFLSRSQPEESIDMYETQILRTPSMGLQEDVGMRGTRYNPFTLLPTGKGRGMDHGVLRTVSRVDEEAITDLLAPITDRYPRGTNHDDKPISSGPGRCHGVP